MGTPLNMLDSKEDTSELVNSVLKGLHQQEHPSQPQQQPQPQQQVNQPMEPTQNIQYVIHEEEDSDENNLLKALFGGIVLYLITKFAL